MCSIQNLNTWLENKLPGKNMAMECMPRMSHRSLAQSEYKQNYRLSNLLFLSVVIHHFLISLFTC